MDTFPPSEPLAMQLGKSRKMYVTPGENQYPNHKINEDIIFIVAEGFLLFISQQLADIFDVKIFISTHPDWQVACERRFKRSGGGGGATSEGFQTWYKDVVWVNFLKRRARQIENAGDGLIMLDAKQSKEELQTSALQALRSKLPGAAKRKLDYYLARSSERRGYEQGDDRKQDRCSML
uniref:Uncharacterized protein n=1 Tax=Lotharella oceanica TaxID=641309 RepID=A0A7S2U336_9EUKA|mmetsp:Transcript_7976/g.15692  ORF Transcript_7976/g.15692 Transcript_7976/m.15692 type:complete len:179 (+) Transcript_7976:406-942(+)